MHRLPAPCISPLVWDIPEQVGRKLPFLTLLHQPLLSPDSP